MSSVTITLDDETISLLQRIAEYHGIADPSIIIRFLAKQEVNKIANENTVEYEGWLIEYQYDESSMGNLAGYDFEASIGKCREMVETELSKEYPGANIMVNFARDSHRGVCGSHVTSVNPGEWGTDIERDVECRVQEIGGRVLASGDWVIEPSQN